MRNAFLFLASSAGSVVLTAGLLSEDPRTFVCETARETLFFFSNNTTATTCSPDASSGTRMHSYFPLTKDHSVSLMGTHLTPQLHSKLSTRLTSHGYTLDDQIRRGVSLVNVPIGIVASDPDAYDVFREIFRPIIESLHHDQNRVGLTQAATSSATTTLQEDDAALHIDGDVILSFRIRAARNIKGFDFMPYLHLTKRKELRDAFRASLDNLNHTSAQFIHLEDLSEREMIGLVRDHLLFQRPSSALLYAGYDGNTDTWPMGRALWLSNNEIGSGLSVWINEEDHLRVIAMTKHRDLDALYTEWQQFIDGLEAALQRRGYLGFAWHEDFGYLATCPTNIGTGMRVSVQLKLQELEHARVKSMCAQLHLECRPDGGERATREGSSVLYEVSNVQKWGLTQEDIVKVVKRGALALVRAEQQYRRSSQAGTQLMSACTSSSS